MSASTKTDNTDQRSRIFNCETHLIDIEVVLDGLRLIDQEAKIDAETSMRVDQISRYLHQRLVYHTAALRKELWPNERIEKGSAS